MEGHMAEQPVGLVLSLSGLIRGTASPVSPIFVLSLSIPPMSPFKYNLIREPPWQSQKLL